MCVCDLKKMYLLAAVLCLIVTCSGASLPSSRILGGADALIEDFPFAASIEWLDMGHRCGAVVLTVDWVLTDSWCAASPNITEFAVRVGSATASNSTTTAETGTLHNVTDWIFHPLADVDNHEYDFALVQVEPPFEFNANVAAAALPAQGQETPEDAFAAVAGWGKMDVDEIGAVTQLQYANMSLIGEAICSAVLGSGYNERTLCAQGANGGVAICWNDEGGPLVVDGTLFGISLWPGVCADPQEVQFFGRVASVRDWIDETIGA